MPLKLFIKSIALISLFCSIQACKNSSTEGQKEGKELFIPEKIWSIPEGNDYTSDESRFSYKRMASTPNIALLWDKDFGDDPSSHTDHDKRFLVDEVLKEGERFYNHYTNVLKFVDKGNSLADKYKMLIFVISDEDQTAYGGGAEEKIGVMWFRPARMKKQPYCTLAHEMGHSFQYIANCDKGGNGRGESAGGYSIIEMCCQWMLWQVYPEWQTYENYHLLDFMKKTHLAFLHPSNMYHSPYVLEYWSTKHGPDIISKIFREMNNEEDPVMTYKRITSTNQKAFNNEMFDASIRFVTWDLERIKKDAKPYANQHICKLEDIGNNWYRITEGNCPENYGYNGISLDVPDVGTEIKINFKGIAGSDGFKAIETDKAGWRYGFIAYTTGGDRIYSDMYSEPEGEIAFTVPNNTQYLWLVVSGAPDEHFMQKNEQWPYQIKISGTTLNKSAIL